MGLPEGERTSMIYLAISHNTEMFQGQGWTYKHVAATISSYALLCMSTPDRVFQHILYIKN